MGNRDATLHSNKLSVTSTLQDRSVQGPSWPRPLQAQRGPGPAIVGNMTKLQLESGYPLFSDAAVGQQIAGRMHTHRSADAAASTPPRLKALNKNVFVAIVA